MNLKKLVDKRVFDFVITSPKVDKEGDVVPENEIDEALDKWIMHGGSINNFHSNQVVGKVLRFWKQFDGKRVARGYIFDDSRVADEAWRKIRDGEYKSVSIGGGSFDKTPNKFGGEDLNDLEIYEVSVCPSGMHPDANILDKNMLAKSTPFFAKADIMLTSFDESKTSMNPVSQSTGSNSSMDGVQVTIENNATKGGSLMNGTDVKKPDPMGYGNGAPAAPAAPSAPGGDVLSAILAKLEAIEAKLGTAPVPSTDIAEATQKDGGIGTTEVNPAAEGGEVKIPLNPDEKRKPAGTPGETEGDKDGVAITQKAIATEVRKALESMGVRQNVSTPRPDVEKSYAPKARKYDAYDIVKGKKTIEDVIKNDLISKLEKKVEMMREFENHWESISKEVA